MVVGRRAGKFPGLHATSRDQCAAAMRHHRRQFQVCRKLARADEGSAGSLQSRIVLPIKLQSLNGGTCCPQRVAVRSISRQRLGDKPLHLQLHSSGLGGLHEPLRRGPTGGFALLITITLLSFVVVLLLGLAVYTRVETSVAGNTQRQAQARENALLGLNVALSQLQKYAGPDTRVTATAAAPNSAAIEG